MGYQSSWASPYDDGPLLDSLLNKTIKRKRHDKHSYINERHNNILNSKRLNSSTNENVLDDNIAIVHWINSIDNCESEFLAAHRNYMEKFRVIELS
ncbi:unnamed protein product [Rotaria sordida]|uniref:Uncharacterized protein n=1 Tax=Rotaria sordida TaxID=392033 RepID=A0A815Y8C6_9BILA|nr:unnamed protein product [Rotaria sordida]CAF1567275.1 unnamed protein product [Rotaria sordida]